MSRGKLTITSTKKKSKKRNLKKLVLELRNIALVVTHEAKIAINYSTKAKTASISLKDFTITITPNLLPKGLEKFPLLFKYALHGEVLHEGLHYVLTLPIGGRYRRFEKRQKYEKLAQRITNIQEDKRINYFGLLRYRFDLGKRLEFLLDLVKKSMEFDTKKQLASNIYIKTPISLFMGALVQKGLYDCDISGIRAEMALIDKSGEIWRDTQKALNLLEEAKYSRVKAKLIESAQKLYDLAEKQVSKSKELNMLDLLPQWLGGGLGGGMGKELKDELKKREKEQKGEQEEEEGSGEHYGAGKGLGDEIPTPEPNFEVYQQLVNENKPEITRLLNKLKKTVKPIVNRAIFRKRGRIMANIITKAYTSSLKRRITNIYIDKTISYEKENIAMGVLVDFSGSVHKYTAQSVITILTEVFGAWLEDKAFSIQVFGQDRQKIKTFFESFSNTRARIGGISVSTSATNIADSLEDLLRQFQSLETERTKVLVIVSDFCFTDSAQAYEMLERLTKAKIRLLFVGISCYRDIFEVLPNNPLTERISVDNVSDLPELFTETYIKTVMPKGR